MTQQQFSARWKQGIKDKNNAAQEKLHEQEQAYQNKLDVLFQGYKYLLLQQEDVFRMSAVGELKAGKSTFLNAIIGEPILHAQSSAATAFPLRIVHKKDTKGIQLKYYYNSVALQTFQQTLSPLSSTDNGLITTFLGDIDTQKNHLTSDETFHEVEKLNDILRMLAKYQDIAVEDFVTSIVPEITLNFMTFHIHGNLDLTEHTVLIDTPGIGEDSTLNQLFKYIIGYISSVVDSNMLVLEKGGKNTKYEEQIINILRYSDNFSVIAGKLDDYNEDIANLLQNKIPTQFKNFAGFKAVYGISQEKFLSGTSVLKDFMAHGKIIDTRAKYIGEMIQKIHGVGGLNSYHNKEDGYEELLKGNEYYQRLLESEYTGGQGQQFQTFLSDFIQQINTHQAQGSSKVDLTNSDDMYKVGEYYSNGEKITKDYTQSIYWYKKAADLGSVSAMNSLGFAHCTGQGVANNFTQAMKWYRKAADLGSSTAMGNIALLYANGDGVSQDYHETMKWYRKSADLGNASSMEEIGELYYRGHGVPKNLAKAREWGEKAAAKGYDSLVLLKMSLQATRDEMAERSSSQSDALSGAMNRLKNMF